MTLAMTLSLLPVTAGAAGTSGLNEELFGTESVDDLETQEDTQQPSSAVTLEHDDTVAGYDSITAAIAATSEYNSKNNRSLYTITLNNDLEEDVEIPANRNIKIDLNGCTLTNVSDHTITNKSTRITITDTSSEKTGTVDNVSHGKGAVYNDINATITLSGGTYMRSKEASTGSDSSGENSWYVLKNFGTMTINSGVTVKFSDDNIGLYSSLIGNGWQNSAAAENGSNGEPKPSDGNEKASLTIKGGTFTGGQITVKNDDYGVLKITDGTITQPSENRYAVANNHTATISGGTIKAKEVVISSRYYDGGANAGTLKISGGTFESETSNAVYISSGADLTMTGGTYKTGSTSACLIAVAEGGNAEISGGEFSVAQVSQVVDTDEAFKDGYGPAWNPDGTISVGVTSTAAEAVVKAIDDTTTNYLTLSAAMSAAPAGSTVVLQRDVTLSKSVSTVNYGVTLDLNGHNIDGRAVSGSNSAVNLKTNYNSKPVEGVSSAMWLINSVPDQGGKITAKSPLNFSAGDSRIPLKCEIGAGVILEVTEGGDNAVKLGSSAYLIYSDTAAGYIKNGGFKAVDSEGNAFIYGTFGNALRADADRTVELLNDYKGSAKITYSSGDSATIDLGEHTYEYTGSEEAVYISGSNKNLTVKNGSVVSNAMIAFVYDKANNTSLIFDKTKLFTNISDSYGIASNGTTSGHKLTLKNSTLNASNSIAVYWPSGGGTVIIEDSQITAHTGVQICAGGLDVKGEDTVITATGTPIPKTDDDGGIADGAAISIVKRDGYQKLGTVSIEAGTFTSEDSSSAIKAYTFNNTDKDEGEWANADETVAVTGGTFTSGDGEKSDVSDYIPDGAALTQNGNGMIIKDTSASTVAQIGTVDYTSLDKALTAANNGTNKTVTLLADATLSSKIESGVTLVVPADKTLTVDATDTSTIGTVLGSQGTLEVQAGGGFSIKLTGSDTTQFIGGSGSVMDLSKGSAEIVFSSKSVTLTSSSEMTVPAGQDLVLSLAGGYPLNTTIADGATANISGKVTVPNTATLTVNGDLNVANSGILRVNSEATLDGSGTLTNSGIITLHHGDTENTTVSIAITLASGGNVYSQFDVTSTINNSTESVLDPAQTVEGVANETEETGSNEPTFGYQYSYYVPSSSSGGSTRYTVTAPTDVANGSVKVSPTRASRGQTVTITVTPDEGYELASLAVYDADGDAVSLTDAGNGKYTFTMPRSKVTVEAAFSEIVEEPETLPFADVPTGAYYYDAVAWAVENGVTNGSSATTFSPNMVVTRAQMVTFLWRAYGSPKATGTNPFTDVSESDYYYDAVLWAVANGVTNGTSGTTFSPDMDVTRAQAVTFQWRAAGSPVVSGSSFGDVATDAYYVSAVTWAVANDITNGTGGNNFSPDVVVSRAQAVTFLYREAH